jgi:ABC-type transport system involved in cytochrome bd biosynthesis fused ATPase/permease subunit
VIKAVKSSLGNSGEVTALWVTHRLEELEYADGAFYMEHGKIVKHGDGASITDFIKTQQSSLYQPDKLLKNLLLLLLFPSLLSPV